MKSTHGGYEGTAHVDINTTKMGRGDEVERGGPKRRRGQNGGNAMISTDADLDSSDVYGLLCWSLHGL